MRINSIITTVLLSLSTLSTVNCASSGDEYGETDDEAASAGKLTFWQASDGQWHFNLKSGNGGILLTSEAYAARTGAINGALSVLDNGVDPAMFEIAPASKGYVVHLLGANREIISFSETYATKSSATRAVSSCVKAITSYLDRREAATGARTEVSQGASGQFHFNFFASNGKIVLSSEHYTTEEAAFNGAFAVQTEGQKDSAYEIKQSASGSFSFTVKALNGQVVGVSEQYTTRAGAESAIASLKALLPKITVL